MSDSDDENPFYGTPLPPLEDAENAPKKADLDLTVRDEKGRRRFHGAFTGGFSAGYFNTVGSVEGWVPSQYISGRRDGKWDKNLMRNKPEDYMDDEDFGAFGIAPKIVQTRDKFKSSEVLGFAGFRDANASIVDVLKDIIKPKTDSIGIKLFKAMRRETKFKNAEVIKEPNTSVKSYGCALPPGFQRQDSDDDDDDDDFTIKFVVPYEPKSNLHGIGFKPLHVEAAHLQKSGSLTATLADGKKLNIKGEAFGYGALEAEDDYDEDAQVYGNDDLSNYDFAIGAKPSTSKSKTSTFTCLENEIHFVPAKKKINKSESFKNKLPLIPRGWRPKPPFYTSRKRKSRWDKGGDSESKKEKIREDSKCEKSVHRTMNANTRAIVLGEEVVRVVGKKSSTEPKEPSSSEVKSDPSNSQQKTNKEVNLKLEDEKLDKLVKPRTSAPFFVDKFVRSDNLEISNKQMTSGLMQSRDIPKEEKPLRDETDVKELKVGTCNRTTYQWHPHTLLAKRFNVPHPYPQFPDVIGTLRIAHTTKTESK